MAQRLHAGIGGWTFEPWRGSFYPPGLPHSRELAHASRQVTAIEINGTFYSSFKPAHFAKWRDETPEGFVFALKGHRFVTHRRRLSTAAEGVQRFVGSGIAELGDKLGPIVWQLMPTTAFDAGELDGFLALLPREAGGRPLRHVIDARHPSFATEAYLELLDRHGCTTVYTDAPQYPGIPHATSDLAYLRLMRSEAECETGYPLPALERWAAGARQWLELGPRKEAFVFFINGAKEKAPMAARAFLKMVA